VLCNVVDAILSAVGKLVGPSANLNVLGYRSEPCRDKQCAGVSWAWGRRRGGAVLDDSAFILFSSEAHNHLRQLLGGQPPHAKLLHSMCW